MNVKFECLDMKANYLYLPVLLIISLFCAGCLGPKFESVSTIPQGHGLVYIYCVPANGIAVGHRLMHNNAKIGLLLPFQYLVQYPIPGANTYGFWFNSLDRSSDDETFLGLGYMIHGNKRPDPEPIDLTVKPGKPYYLKVIGQGLGSSIGQVDESIALHELQQCRKVETIDANK